MELMFLGAAREVTGSIFMLKAAGSHVLIDCGMEQGEDTYENQTLPVSASQVDCVVLTHAHIDHSGMLPALYKDGFRGAIYASSATIALCDIMLRDSAHIQESEAEWRNRKSKRSGESAYTPLYTMADAEGALQLMRPASYTESTEIAPGIELRLTDAGHLLGSASVTLTVTEDNLTKRIVFSGDIGNLDQPIINDPQHLTDADIVVMESTYGDRTHGPRPDYLADLADALQTTFDRGGNVVIPSFAVGRTQDILYFLREIKERGMVKGHDHFPVYMDSPLAINATEIFKRTDPVYFDQEMNDLLQQGINPISFDGLTVSLTVDESKQINMEKRPCVIISASGMAEAGRIRHHLKHNLWRRECTVLFVGYQSVGTLGRALYDGASEVRIFGEDIQVNVEIRMLKALSGHADRNGLKAWADSFDPPPERFFIVHGEESSALSFAELLRSEGHTVEVPYNGDAWDLAAGVRTQSGPRTLVKGVRRRRESIGAATPRPAGSDADLALNRAMDRLVRLIRQGSGWSNGIKRQLAEQINKLVSRWE
ncbi:MAG: MBL fold metallo-hydrolase [Clostridiales bacterium]|nr:MBL fold metallo-hydrolase [Clostridiales bacterium]